MTRERTATFVHQGGERFSGTTGTGRSIVFGDDTSKNEYSPVESLVASLGSCSAMDVISIATKKRQAIERYEVHVTAIQRDEYPQVLTEADVVHEVWGRDLSVAAIRRAIELSATKYCPINAMVSAGPTVVHHRFRVHSSGATQIENEGEVIATGPFRRPEGTV